MEGCVLGLVRLGLDDAAVRESIDATDVRARVGAISA
jgi:hypothetical protein